MKQTERTKIYRELLMADDERLEGLDAIRKFIDPSMCKRTFYQRHREALRPYIVERKYWWRKKLPQFYSFKRLILLYMLRRKII
jgi:hypothetical protein